MRYFLAVLLIVLIIFFQYQARNHPELYGNSLSDRILHPFDTRLRYRIAEVDPRFGMSTEQLIEISEQATKIWSDATGKSYFVYDPNARLALYFQYDDRQYETEQRQKHIQNIDHEQHIWTQKKQYVDQQQQQLDSQRDVLNIKQKELDELILMHNNMITQINQSGGAPREQKQQLEAQSSEIEQQISVMKTEIAQHNFNIQRINHQVDELNQINQKIDVSIMQFNQKFQPRLFDKGSFNGRSIHIYEFENENDLRLTLAHEFGHALGLKHHDTATALMYPMLKDQDMQNFRLQPADLALLAARKTK